MVLRTASARKFPYAITLQFPMSPRRTVFKRWSLPSKTAISRCRLAKVQSYEFLFGNLVCSRHSSHVGSALEVIKRKRYFKAYMESNKVYTEQRSRIKLAKAQLAELDDPIIGEAGTSRKSNKKSNVTCSEVSPADPALQADLISEIKQAQEATDKAKAKREQAAMDVFQLYVNLLSVNAYSI
jgi:hypothetical protein